MRIPSVENLPMWLLVWAVVTTAGAEDRVLPQQLRNAIGSLYESRRQLEDPISKQHSWVLEVTIEDSMRPSGCTGWIVQVAVPSRWAPPYYDGNHHYEYWGINEDRQYYLGKGEFFELTQDVALDGFRDYVDDTCGGRPDEKSVATMYLQVTLAGRFPFEAGESQVPRCWHWIRDVSELRDSWRAEVAEAGSIPPSQETDAGGTRFSGCVLARVGGDHEDVGCWEVRFVPVRGLISARETYRRQSTPGFVSDRPRRR